MQILTPEKIKSDIQLKTEVSKRIATETAKEADNAIKRLNNISSIEEQVVLELEQRKKLALEPIEKEVLQSKILLQKIKNKEIDLQTREEKLSEEYDALDERKDQLNELEKSLILKKNKLEVEESQIRRSSQELSKKWVEYHESVHKFNKLTT